MYTDADLYQHMVIARDEWIPLLRQACDQCVGARREYQESLKNIQMIPTGGFYVCHGTKRNAQFMHAFTDQEWGERSEGLVKSMCTQNFKRHHIIARNGAFGAK